MDVAPLGRFNEPDVDAVHEDVLRGDLYREGLREGKSGGTIDRGGEELGVRVTTVDRADVHYAPSAGCPHEWQHFPATADQREELDVEVLFPIVVGQRVEIPGCARPAL